MIASLCGQLQAIKEGAIILDVGGVGYLVHITGSLLSDLPQIGKELMLHTHMVVRENAIALYGFPTSEECDLFAVLLDVNSIGPRTALALLSGFSPEVLRGVIGRGEVAALTRIPGIGRKTAERLVLDLKDKMGSFGGTPERPALSQNDVDVVNALTALGYSLAEAQRALAQAPDESSALDERILAALRFLGS